MASETRSPLRGHAKRPSFPLTTAVWVLPSALLSTAAALMLAQGIPSTLALTTAAASSIVALVGAVSAVARGLRPVAASFYVFWFSWLGVGPIAQMSLGKVAWNDTSALSDPAKVQLALMLTLAGIISFVVGDAWGRRSPSRSPAARTPAAAVLPAIQALLSVALIAVGANAIRTLGLATFFTSRQARGQATAASVGRLSDIGGPEYALYNLLPVALSVAVALLASYQLQQSWRGIRHVRATHLFHLVLGLLGIAIFANPISQTRFIALMAVGSLALVWLRPRRTRAGVIYVSIGLIATLLIYPLANVFRAEGKTAGEVTLDTFTSNDFDGFQQVINAVNYVEAVGISWGHHALSALLFFVPRSLWPDKAEPASLEISSFAGYQFTNLSLPIHAEFYLQGGFLGLVIGMTALGYCAARLDAHWLAAPMSRLGMLAPAAALAVVGLLRGPLGSQTPVWMPVIFLIFLCTRSSERHFGRPTGRRLTAATPARGRGSHPRSIAG